MSKLAKLHFRNHGDFQEALSLLDSQQVYSITVDADKIDPAIFPKAMISYEETELSDHEKRRLILWLNENAEGDDFLESLKGGLRKYRRLTPKQYTALRSKFVRVEGEEP